MDFACSSFSWETAEGLHLLGRTYDQVGGLGGNQVGLFPQGYPLPIEAAGGGLLRGRYAFAGMAVMELGSPVVVDGVNEQGLMGVLLNYPGYAQYPALPNRFPIYSGFLLWLLLSQCDSVEQAAQAAEKICPVDYHIQGTEMQVHYMMCDASGEAIILEPGERGLEVYRQTLGVLTNSPDYLWQRTNLRNYVGITGKPKPPQSVCDFEISGFGADSGGCFGLPGGYSSPDRFVRLAFAKQFGVKVSGEEEGVAQMFRIFGPVDIPKGILGCNRPGDYMQTLCVNGMCSESRTYYFAPADNRRISALRVTSEAAAGSVRFFHIQEQQNIVYLN